MNASCPHCRTVLKLKSVKPGRFAASCPHCGKSVIVIVPDDPDSPVSVSRATPLPVRGREHPELPDTIRFPMLDSSGEPIDSSGEPID